MKFNQQKKWTRTILKLKINHPPPREESHPMRDALRDSRSNAKKQENRLSLPNVKNNNNKHDIVIFYK